MLESIILISIDSFVNDYAGPQQNIKRNETAGVKVDDKFKGEGCKILSLLFLSYFPRRVYLEWGFAITTLVGCMRLSISNDILIF